MTTYAEFARTKGAKDKGKRKRRGAMIAGGATALAGAGYGASIPLRAAMGKGYARTDMEDYAGNKGLPLKERARNVANRTKANMGAVVASDRAAIGRGVQAVREYDYKGIPSRAKSAVTGAYASAREKAGAMAGSKYGKAILGTKTSGRILRGAGALGAGAAGAAGILAYLNAKKKAKKSKSLRGRISSAMGRK